MKNNRIAIIFIIIFSLAPQFTFAQNSPYMDVHYIDVGQGDSILIETPNGKTILIDGGLPEAGNKVASYLKKQNIKKIDLLVATHPDYDHIGGLIDVMQKFEVKKIMDTGKFHLTKSYAKYSSEIRKQAIPKTIARAGQTIAIDSDLTIDVLHPNVKTGSNNSSSIVLKVTYEDIGFLFMGDVTMKQENMIMEKFNVQSDFIKIGHHGSDTSSSLEFLQQVNPTIAILSFSVDNKYGHPVERVVENLDLVDAQVFSTASYGDIIIRTNGVDYLIFSNQNPTDQLIA